MFGGSDRDVATVWPEIQRPPSGPKRERGVALLLALLIVALAALIATRLFELTSSGIARGESQARLQDAYLLSQGMEDFALVLLKRDLDLGDGIDTRSDAWARPLPPLPVPGGRVGGLLRDLDGRFNLNTLVRNDLPDAVARARFARLLAALELEPALLDAVSDWIDADSQVAPQGAEDLDYLRADPPYRAANRPFVHVSELRRIQGIDDKVYRRLAPEVSALPADVGLNINTMSVFGMMSLADGISQELARQLSRDGQAQYRSMTELVDALAKAGVMLDPAAIQGLGVSSRYFVARADVELGGRNFTFYSLLQRSGGGGRVLQRMQSGYE
jgi:general secretion pathway protein K